LVILPENIFDRWFCLTMIRNHAFFGLFLTLLLIAPKLNLGVGIQSSTVSMGLFGLLIWALFNVSSFTNYTKNGTKTQFYLLFFSFYALAVSLASEKHVSMIYSIQYLAYVLLGVPLLSNYFSKCKKRGELSIPAKIVSFIVFLYAGAVIVSVWTGPIYPGQTLWTARQWGGLYLQQGVGFSESQNEAGVVLAVCFAFVISFMKRGFFKKTLSCVVVAALFLTLSRGSIYAFCTAIILLLLLSIIRGITIRGVVFNPLTVSLFFFILAVALIIVVAISGMDSKLIDSISMGISIGGSAFQHGFNARTELWMEGIQFWKVQNFLSQLFGVGFRNSVAVNAYGQWSDSHNIYVEVLGDFGVIGLALFVVPMIAAVIQSAKRFLETASPFAMFVFMSVIALMVDGMTDTFLYSPIAISLVVCTYTIVSFSQGTSVLDIGGSEITSTRCRLIE